MYALIGEDVAALIGRYRLHEGDGPVRLDALVEDLCDVREASLMQNGVLGVALPTPAAAALSPGAKGRIMVDRHLTRAERRLVIAHEIGHLILPHIGLPAAHAAEPSPCDDEQEREAWQIAAALLVPVREVWSGDPPAEIAERNGVPIELVTHHPWRPERWLAEPMCPESAGWRRALVSVAQGSGLVVLG